MWYDNWHPLGPLLSRFGSWMVYDAACSIHSEVEIYVDGLDWRIPRAVSSELLQITANWATYRPNASLNDVSSLNDV